MAPKKNNDIKAMKRVQDAKKKAVEDKTFGLKNKNKSKKVQTFVEGLQKSVVNKDLAKEEAKRKAAQEAKKAKQQMELEMQKMMANVIVQPKLPPGTDPKSVLCEFFKHGKCRKGDKCKFSHDMGVQRKGAKANIYEDEKQEEKEEGMDDWDQETLEAAVKQKHGAENGRPNKTKIICKYFLDAVEKRQYGWFWKCPNGPECIYRHALPPGYVLKSQMKAMLEEEAANAPDVTEVMEEERRKVNATTKITEEVFRQWHARKWEEKRRQWAEEKQARVKAGRLTGREIYESEGFEARDEDGATDEYEREGKDTEAQEEKAMERAARRARRAARAAAGEEVSESEGEDEAGAGGAGAGGGGGVETTLDLEGGDAEELFGGDDDDDEEDMLDELEEELEAKAAV
ncbi:unnamed protein product [Pedinophyceae sp. YPF-701]|nr:unnamed protein product [Pedinophyceae sp. YPF-701]